MRACCTGFTRGLAAPFAGLQTGLFTTFILTEEQVDRLAKAGDPFARLWINYDVRPVSSGYAAFVTALRFVPADADFRFQEMPAAGMAYRQLDNPYLPCESSRQSAK